MGASAEDPHFERGVSTLFLHSHVQAGSLEGTVVDIGLHSTHLVDQDKHAVVVPNSFFSNQVKQTPNFSDSRTSSLKLVNFNFLGGMNPEYTDSGKAAIACSVKGES